MEIVISQLNADPNIRDRFPLGYNQKALEMTAQHIAKRFNGNNNISQAPVTKLYLHYDNILRLNETFSKNKNKRLCNIL